MKETEKRWYAIYTLYRHEKRVGINLTAKGIEAFVPVQEEVHLWKDRKKKIERAVIPMMIFVHITQRERISVLSTPSVSRFLVLRGEHTPAVIPDCQIESFKFMLGYSQSDVEYCESALTVGQKVKVIRGTLKGLEGKLVKIDGKSKIYIDIDLLGSFGVEIDAADVKVIE